MKHCSSLLLCLLFTIPAHAHIAKAQAVRITGYANSQVSVPGYHSALIENKTDFPQDYSYSFQTCVDQWRCSKMDDFSGHVHLHPHTSIEKPSTTIVTVIYNKGTYPISV